MPGCWPHTCLRIGCNHISGVQELTHADRERRQQSGELGLLPTSQGPSFLQPRTKVAQSPVFTTLLLGLSVHLLQVQHAQASTIDLSTHPHPQYRLLALEGWRLTT